MTGMTMNEFFSKYEQAFSELDAKKQAELFADTFLTAGPQGTIAHSKEEWIKLADSMAGVYRSIGQDYVKILTMHEQRISDEYAMVNVRWGAKFKKIPNKLIEFDVSYLVQQIGDSKKIILSIAHQDEAKAMESLGLVPAQA
jgi:hypothetical protein